jgi:hypothetical protein
VNYQELVTAIESYTENNFPTTTLADGTTVTSTTQINRFIEQAEQRIFNTIQFPSLRKNVTGSISYNNKYLNSPDDFLSVFSIAVIDSSGVYTYLLNKDVNFIREAYPDPTSLGQPKYYAIFGPQSGNANELTFILGPTPDSTYSTELHYYYYPASIILGAITATTITTTGSSLVSGTYYNVSLTNGSGNSVQATVVVSGGILTKVTITNAGAYYVVGDVLTIPTANIGGTGVAPTVTVSSVSNSTGQSWLGDNFDSVLLYGSLMEAYTYMKGEPDLIALYTARYTESLAEAKRLGDGLERQDAYRSGQYRQAVT